MASARLFGGATQNLDCGIGGKQKEELIGTAPASTLVNQPFYVTIGGDATRPAKAAGAEIKNLKWEFDLSTCGNYSVVSAPVISNNGTQGKIISGSGTLGNMAVSLSGHTITLSASGSVGNGAVFVAPAFTIGLSVSSKGKCAITTSDPAYELSAHKVIWVNVKCSPSGGRIPWTTTIIN
eukprot:JZ548071.1.p1 GENE.JZ548071.1~~JZ548071.1.p1  ORF type:complete len:190 (+),score=35.93 JZ548071.1:32-571(+)